MEIRSVGAELFHTVMKRQKDGQTGMTKLIFAFLSPNKNTKHF